MPWLRTTALDQGLQMAASLACRCVLFGHSVFSDNLILFPAFKNQEIPLTCPDFQFFLKKLEDLVILGPHFGHGSPLGGVCALQLAAVPRISLHWPTGAFEFRTQRQMGSHRE